MTNPTGETAAASSNTITEPTPEVGVQENDEANTQSEAEAIAKDPNLVKEPHKEVIRVVLWTAPRSLSTAFERCMTRVPNAKIFNEMYGAAFLLGPQRKVQWWPKLAPKHSYKYCKKRLEAEHAGYDFVFAKDFAMQIHLRPEVLPKGYQHAFLIRDPVKMFNSLRATLCTSNVIRILSGGGKIRTCFPTEGYFYEDMWGLYTYLRDHPDYPVPIILDADDIIRDPEGMVKKFCETIGLTFSPDMLKWEKASMSDLPWEGAKFYRVANWMSGCYKNALESTGFKKGGTKKRGNQTETKTSNSGARVPSNAVDVEKTANECVELDPNNEAGVWMGGAEPNPGASSAVPNHKAEQDTRVTIGTGPDNVNLTNTNEDRTTGSDYLTGLHPDVLKAVKYSLPFYRQLYANRVVLDKVPRI